MAEQGDAVVSSSINCLLSVKSTQSLLSPIEGSNKIKYTCITASQHYIALGANTGGVYCFHRDGFKYIRILASKEGSVSQVRFSPNENNMAVCSGGGFIVLWELNLQEQGVSKRLHVSSVLKDAAVKDMIWDNKGTRVFFGDFLGRVAVTHIPKQMLFKKPDEVVLQERVPVVQLDFHQEQLLVSTQTRCVIFKLLTKELIQVGFRARDGPFGACFHSRWPDRPPIVFSTRPGGRLWQADVKGTVVSTLKLKDTVTMPATPILGAGFQPDFVSASAVQLSQLLNFAYLYILHNTYMVCWVDDKLFLFEPASYSLAAWTSDLAVILDVYSDGRQLFVLREGVDGVSVSVLSFVSLETCVHWLVESGLLMQASQVLEVHSNHIVQKLPSDELLYIDVKTTLESLKGKKLGPGLEALEMSLSKLKDKFDQHVQYQKENDKSEVIESVDFNEEGGNISKDDEDGFKTVDLNSFSNSELDSSLETEHVTFSNNPLSTDSNHMTLNMTLNTDHVTIRLPIQDSSADFPSKTPMLMDSSANYLNEPDLDSTLIPNDPSSEHSDSESLPLNSSSVTSLRNEDISPVPPLSSNSVSFKDDCQESSVNVTNIDDRQESSVNVTNIDDRQESSVNVTNISPFPEEVGLEFPMNHTRSLSRAIPPQVDLKFQQSLSGQSSEGNSESCTSVGGQVVKVSLSEPQSYENHSSLNSEPVRIPVKVSTDFANRVAAALSSFSPDDNGVIAVPVRSSSGGSSKESGKTRSKKRSSRKKKSVSPVHSIVRKLSTPELGDSISKTPSPLRSSISLIHIPEEETLPFPEAGLPPTPPTYTSYPTSVHSSAASSQNVSPLPSLPSSPPRNLSSDSLSSSAKNGSLPKYPDTGVVPLSGLAPADGVSDLSVFGGLQKRSALLSKVKSIAKQGGVNLIESNNFQRPVKMVKGLFSSLASPPQITPSSQFTESQPNVFHNDNFGFLSPIMASPLLSPPAAEEGEIAGSLSPPACSTEDQSTVSPLQPDPEIEEFVSATVTTIRRLDDPEVYCSPGTMSALLRRWLAKLKAFREHLSSFPLYETDPHSNSETQQLSCSNRSAPFSRTAVSSVFLSPGYLNVTPVVRQMVTDLLSICADLALYEDSSDLSPPTGKESKEEGRGVEEFVSCFCTVLDLQRLGTVLSSLEWDVRVRIWKQMAEMYREDDTLTAKSIPDLFSNESPPSNSLSQLPALLLRLHWESPEAFLDSCISYFPMISPWQVAATCEINQSNDWNQSHDNHTDQSGSTTNDTRNTVYLNYLSQLLITNKRQKREELEAFLYSDPHLLLKSLELSLSYHTRLVSRQDHDVHYFSQESFRQFVEHLLQLCVSMKGADLLSKAREVCSRNRYWLGVVWLSVAMGDKRKALHVLLCLKDLSLFTNEQKWGNLLNTLDDWRLLLELMSSTDSIQLDKGITASLTIESSTSQAPCSSHPPSSKEPDTDRTTSTAQQSNSCPNQDLNSVSDTCADEHNIVTCAGEHTSDDPVTSLSQACHELEQRLSNRSELTETCEDLPSAPEVRSADELTWSGVLRLMIGSLPPSLIIKLLPSCHGDSFGIGLCEQLHSLLPLLTQIQAKQRSLGHSLLERVDRYLWSPRTSALGPQLLSVQNSEKLPSEPSQDNPSLTLLSLTSVSSTTSSFIEDSSSHWGVRTQRGSFGPLCCPLCRLPVLCPVSDLHPGVVVLSCGHSFHKRCLPEMACVLCFAMNVQDKVKVET